MDVFGDASLFSVFVDDDTARQQQQQQQQQHQQPQQSALGKRTLEAPAVAAPAPDASDAASSAKKAKGVSATAREPEPEDEPVPEVEPPVVTVETTELATAQPNEIGHVTHTVCVPSFMTVTDGMRNPAYPPPRPAREYKFTLDPFQKMSIAILERQESVLVAAHTSAGKTVVAEYAIAMGLRDQQRVIYTSPLKVRRHSVAALSNQKYRELDEIFGDVGLMTGDVTINPTASCIVMTTEILRSMLYRGSEVMREVATVVFDEIHYMRDPERGVVWEETIILLPQKVKYVFLSATIPNSEEFSAWIAHTHKQPCHVVYTDIRPVPLQHYVFPAGGAGLHLVVDDSGTFREDNFQRAIAGVVAKPTGGRSGTTKEAGQSDIFKIVQLIMTKNYDPVIVFAFSKKECESLAMQMGKLSFNSEDEKKLTRDIFANAIEPLSADDQQLPQIQHVLPLLQKGIGIHHSGLLPLVKEVIEILFQEGLIKCLFATETFAMGLNMPAHTAVFSSVRKYDGREFRWISGGEYIQMSGRAGRRGKDDRGIVILMVDEKMEPDVAKGMLKGHAQPLLSAFHITYSMLLNLMRVEGLKPEALIGASFAAFQAQRKVPELQAAVTALRAELAEHTAALASMSADDAAAPARELVQIRAKLEALRQEWENIVLHPVFSLPYLQAGRLLQVDVSEPGASNPRLVWGVCIAFAKLGAGSGRADYVLDVLALRRADEGWVVAQVPMTHLRALSSLRLPLPSDLRTPDARKGLGRKVEGICARFAPRTPPMLDPIEDMNIRGNTALERVIKRLYTLETRLLEPRFSSAECTAAYGHAVEEARLTAVLQARQTELSNARHQYLATDLQRMRRVLRRLQFITEDDVIDIKGRITCEIQASDELLLLEMLFNGLFNDMTPQLVAALLSTFVFDSERKKEKEGDPSAVPPQLMREIGPALRTMQSLARRVATVMMECKIEISPDDYVAKFNPGMINVVYQWANGAKFSDICKLSSAFEGHIIRVIRRLEELLRQLMQASKTIGNAPLEQKFSAAIVSIKRDVVFSSSLYL